MPRCGSDNRIRMQTHTWKSSGFGDITMGSAILLLREFTILLVTGKVMVLPGVNMVPWEETADAVSSGVWHLEISYHPWRISCQHN